MSRQKKKIRILLRGFESRLLDEALRLIISTVRRTGVETCGPIPLPTGISKFTVLRGPHIDKESREQFELRTHKRLLDILEPTQQAVEALMGLDLPAGVEVEVKL